MGDNTYVTHAIKNQKKRMDMEGFEYNKKLSEVNYSLKQPFSNIHYCPEMYLTYECYDSQIKYFYNHFRIMQCTF